MRFHWFRRSNPLATSSEQRAGQTIVEVIIATGIIALVLTTIVAAVSSSVKNTALARSKALGIKYAQQGMEFFRNQRAAMGWEAFGGYFQTAGTTFCMPSIPATFSQLTVGACSSTGPYVDANSTFTRQAQITLTTNNGLITNVKVVVTVNWVDGFIAKSTTTTQNFQQWSLPDTNTVDVLSGSNAALGKPTTQSSTLPYYDNTQSGLAVDGNTDGNYTHGSVSITNTDQYAWWQVDLGTNTYISTISIWNRTDCCGANDTNVDVFISPTPFTSTIPATTKTQQGVVWQNIPGQVGSPTTLTFNNYGRYVRVQAEGTIALELAEVQVFAGTPP